MNRRAKQRQILPAVPSDVNWFYLQHQGGSRQQLMRVVILVCTHIFKKSIKPKFIYCLVSSHRVSTFVADQDGFFNLFYFQAKFSPLWTLDTMDICAGYLIQSLWWRVRTRGCSYTHLHHIHVRHSFCANKVNACNKQLLSVKVIHSFHFSCRLGRAFHLVLLLGAIFSAFCTLDTVDICTGY